MTLLRALTVLALVLVNACAWIVWATGWAILSGGASQSVADGSGPEPSMWRTIADWITLFVPPAVACYLLNLKAIRRLSAHSVA